MGSEVENGLLKSPDGIETSHISGYLRRELGAIIKGGRPKSQSDGVGRL